MIGWFNVSFERIFGNQSGTQVGLIAELENSVPLDVPAGEYASDMLRKIR
jgi:hypothetical protein